MIALIEMKLNTTFTFCVFLIVYFIRSGHSGVVSVVQWPQKGPSDKFPDSDGDGIRGTAGKDYPINHIIPKTSFTCTNQIPGYYADTETNCQVFHLCMDKQKMSFLCGNGTVFNQKLFTCDWWYNTSCEDAPQFYGLNALLYKEELKKIQVTEDDKNVKIQKQKHFPNSRVAKIILMRHENPEVNKLIVRKPPNQNRNNNRKIIVSERLDDNDYNKDYGSDDNDDIVDDNANDDDNANEDHEQNREPYF